MAGAAELKNLLGTQIDKLAEGSADKERIAALKEQCVTALQERFQSMLGSEISAKAVEAMTIKQKRMLLRHRGQEDAQGRRAQQWVSVSAQRPSFRRPAELPHSLPRS